MLNQIRIAKEISYETAEHKPQSELRFLCQSFHTASEQAQPKNHPYQKHKIVVRNLTEFAGVTGLQVPYFHERSPQ